MTEQAAPPAEVASGTGSSNGKAGMPLRLLGVVAFVLLAFGAAVMLVAAINPDSIPLCSEGVNVNNDCFDSSKLAHGLASLFAWPAGVLGALAAIAALAFTFTGRHSGLLAKLSAAAVACAVISVVAARL